MFAKLARFLAFDFEENAADDNDDGKTLMKFSHKLAHCAQSVHSSGQMMVSSAKRVLSVRSSRKQICRRHLQCLLLLLCPL